MVFRHNVGVDQIVKPKRKALKIVLFSILAIILGVGIWVGVSAYRAIGNVTSLSGGNGNLFSLLTNKNATLQGQTDGRTNILLLGYGGGNHAGGDLTDTMQVLSINWKTNQMAMVSVPRDLWVNIPGVGYSRVNYAYVYGESNSKTTGGGSQEASKVVSQILGVPIQYTIAINFTGFTDIVNTVGGVDVNVPTALYDSAYPVYNDCNNDTGHHCQTKTFSISAGPHHLDAATALEYARCRHGNCGDDWGRSRRQQQIMEALKTKFLSLNFLADPIKVTSLLNTLGNNLRTTLSVNESYSLWTEIKGIDSSKMITKVIDNSADGVLVPYDAGGASVQIPKKGINNYTDLQAIAKNIFVDTTSTTSTTGTTTKTNSDPKIQVLNGSGKAGQATLEADVLEKSGYTQVTVGNAAVVAKSAVYNCGGVSTQTVADKIAKTLNVTTQTKTSCGSIDIQVIVGQNALTR